MKLFYNFFKEEILMRNTKKILAAMCALSFCVSAAACGSSSSSSSTDAAQTTVSNVEREESEKEVIESAASKLEEKELANKVVKFLSHWDINPAEGTKVPADIQMFRDKYKGEFKYISSTWETRYTDLATAVVSNDAPDFFSAMDMDGFPKGAIKAMFQPIDDYIKLDSELWAPAKTVNDNFIYNGKHYVAAIQAEPDIICIYNPKTIEDKGYEDPAELYYKGEWTWDKFAEMCIDFTDEDNDYRGLDGWWYAKAMGHISGLPLIGMKDGKVVENFDDPTVAKVQEKMYQLQLNHVCFDLAANNWQIRNNTTGSGCGSGETLFYPCGLWGITGKPEDTVAFGHVEEGEIMFVPMPKLDKDSKHYVTARDDGYFLCKGAQNPEGWAAYMNCRMVAKNDLAAVGEEDLRTISKWNEDMIKMRAECYKLVNENPVFDFTGGVSDDMSNAMMNVTQGTVLTSGAQSWTQIVEANKKSIDFIIDGINQSMS